ncbi:uncharacterized protein LOC122004227 [Zingiber officinale]|uniref:uncharacterized protein LOC122004227 n=1 Tax=Zingiber officinale TaxID=94328 RepID=UPI001C4D0511|nr:uncharacterized protein LOC122004227 [Zingiber officinale]
MLAVSKDLTHASVRGSKRKQPEELPSAFYRELDLDYHHKGSGSYNKKEQPWASMAESSPPRYSKKGKTIALREKPRVEPEEQVPFSTRVLKERLLKGYKPPAIGEYDGSKDPEFDGLSNGSITYFHDFKTVFLRHFANSRKYQKKNYCLFALKQGLAEPLRSYIKHFNQVAKDVPLATSEILMSAFSHGLVEGEFFRDLIRDPAKNFDKMLGRAASYINVEEAQAARRKADKAPASTNKPEKRPPQPLAQPLPHAWDARPPFGPGQDPRPVPRVAAVQAPRPGPWGPRYCTYHRSHTHATSDCFQFACDSQRVAELGLPPPELVPKLQRLVDSQQVATGLAGQLGRPQPDLAGHGNQQPSRNQEPGATREEENWGNVAILEINMISGGPTDRDSTRA